MNDGSSPEGAGPEHCCGETWEHSSLPCPARCQFGWAPFRMGALFSRIHRRVLGERLQAVAALERSWLESQSGGHEGEKTESTHSLGYSILIWRWMKREKWLITSGIVHTCGKIECLDCKEITHYDAFCSSLNWWKITQISSLNLMNFNSPIYRLWMSFFCYQCNMALCLHPVCSQPVCFSLSLFCCRPALQQELLKPWQVRFLLCYLLFIWKCSLLSVSGDWLSIAVCSSVHIYMNGWLCWRFLFPGLEERATHTHTMQIRVLFLIPKSTFRHM